MTLGQAFLKELLLESVVTRRYLASVPFDKLDFKPAEKSETLGRLAVHIAEITAWWTACIEANHLDFIDFEPKVFQTKAALLHYFDTLLDQAKQSLLAVRDEEFEKEWSMKYGKEILFTLPKKQVARIFCMNHVVHHRAQLGVYFRLLDIPVPAVYGPSADDEQVSLIMDYNKIIFNL